MANLHTGPVLESMAQFIVDDLGEVPGGLVMYAEVAGRRIDCVIYRNAGATIVHRPCPASLLAKIRLARRMEEADKRWCGIRYDIENGSWSARMTYPEQIRAHETFDDRRNRLEIATFGRKTQDDELIER